MGQTKTKQARLAQLGEQATKWRWDGGEFQRQKRGVKNGDF